MPRFTVLKILGATNGVTSKRTAVQTLGNQEESQCIYIYKEKVQGSPERLFPKKPGRQCEMQNPVCPCVPYFGAFGEAVFLG